MTGNATLAPRSTMRAAASVRIIIPSSMAD